MELIRLLTDFGLVVLIVLVQLCIYPAFVFFEEKNLQRWHATYTQRITIVVLPLMLTQLIIGIYQVYLVFNWFTIVYFLLVSMTWLSTFLIYVPLHQKIDTATNKHKTSKKLIRLNLWRVFLWISLFLVSLWKFLI